MKNIPILLLTAYRKGGRSTCYAVKLEDRDGNAYGFASVDCVLHFNDGEHNLLYYPDQELRPQNIMQTSDMDVDTTDLSGWFGPVIEQKISAGLFRDGKITIYRLMYTRIGYGAEVVAYGTIGEVEYAANAGGKRRVEYRSLTQKLKQHLNPLYSLTCRAEYGDEDCTKPFVWYAGTVGDVQDQFFRFRVDGVAQPDAFFDLGVLEVLDGENAGNELEIENWTSDGWLTISFGAPYPVPVGALVRLRQDCDKTATTCKARGNIINMRAEHLTPVQEQSIMVPGAYIKSDNAL